MRTLWRYLWMSGLVSGSAGPAALAADVYRAGDVVQDFSLVDRATREPVKLSDWAGSIVFLEWFAWWCPFCQASAPQVEAGIVDWYRERAGNPDGIPVLHVAVNLQPNQEAQTQNFIDRAGFGVVLEDFGRAVAGRLQSGGQPIFAIINGVTNSPSHQPWELLLHQDGYGQRDFSSSLAAFRAAIDGVKKAAPPPNPPQLGSLTPTGDGDFDLEIVSDAGRQVVVEASADLRQWDVLLRRTNQADTLRVRLPANDQRRFFRGRAE